jgi:hypothetical protein
MRTEVGAKFNFFFDFFQDSPAESKIAPRMGGMNLGFHGRIEGVETGGLIPEHLKK